jgi:hypothetical protein
MAEVLSDIKKALPAGKAFFYRFDEQSVISFQ